jgi:GNAT superfamily N-acetyltransferase
MSNWHTLEIEPVTSERWTDLETLFGKHGAYGGCWCMFWRLPQSEFQRQAGEGNRLAFQKVVEEGPVPGLLAYADGKPVGWISVASRQEFSRLSRSRILKPVDNQPVWSIVCFYILKGYRRMGLTVELLKAAVEYAARHGAQIVEGYPIDPGRGDYPDAHAYMGLISAYRKVGFVEVARRSERHPIMRYFVG